MTMWLITIPVWGERCHDSLKRHALPSVRAALAHAPGVKARFVIHTDDEARVAASMRGLDATFRPVASTINPHVMLGFAHRQAIKMAAPNERVALLCADMVLSRECFAAAEARFSSGTKLVMNAASRTLGGDPPLGAEARELLAWTMRHKHPSIEECFWGSGRCSVPWAIYFRKGDNVSLRPFHLHPFAFVKSDAVKFSGTTVDFDLCAAFPVDQIHVVQSADEMSMAELSPPDRVFPLLPEPMTERFVSEWAALYALPSHRHFFQSRPIVIAGDGQCDEQETADRIVGGIAGVVLPGQ